MATIIWPELTTIHQPVVEMARLATRMLTEAASQGSMPKFGMNSSIFRWLAAPPTARLPEGSDCHGNPHW